MIPFKNSSKYPVTKALFLHEMIYATGTASNVPAMSLFRISGMTAQESWNR